MFLRVCSISSVCFILAGCVSLAEPTLKERQIHSNTVLSSTASLSHTLVRGVNDKHIICAQTAPDATFDQDDAFSFSFAIVNTGSSDAGGDEEGTEEAEMAGRTPVLLLSRELFYRTCEFATNYNLNKAEAKELFSKTLDTVSQAWMVEAGNTTITIGDAVNNSVGLKLSDIRSGNDVAAAPSSSDEDEDEDEDDY